MNQQLMGVIFFYFTKTFIEYRGVKGIIKGQSYILYDCPAKDQCSHSCGYYIALNL